MNIFVSGGCKNGKSTFAQEKAEELFRREKAAGRADTLYYLATMIPADDEDRQRIKRHVEDREGKGYTTVEQPRNVNEAADSRGVFLLDSVTALMSNEMFDSEGNFDADAPQRVCRQLTALGEKAVAVVYVSDYIYGDGTEGLGLTGEYMRGLSLADRTLAEFCDKVYEVNFGNIIEYK